MIGCTTQAQCIIGACLDGLAHVCDGLSSSPQISKYLASSLLAEHCGDVLQPREVEPSPLLHGKLSAVSIGDTGLRVH